MFYLFIFLLAVEVGHICLQLPRHSKYTELGFLKVNNWARPHPDRRESTLKSRASYKMASAWDVVGASASSSASATPQDILHEVNVFLQGATCQRKVPVDHLAQSALFLLQKMPAARDAILEHFCNVFDDAAGVYIRQIDAGQKQEKMSESNPNQYAVLQEVTGVLLNFINTNPEAWAPIVSSWSLTLLGQISSKYSAHQSMITLSNSLNELLQLWMTCPPTKLLMDLATECFAAMVGGAPDICVDALLEASVKYSPHFDWVVARIGSCFPTTIITRVLNCGLKDFCNVGKDMSDRDPGARKKIPKMASVVGILGHLASKHQQDIRKALMALFEEGLQSEGDAMRVTTVPFLLQLASMSPMLLQVLTTDLIKALTPPVLNRLHHQFSAWKMSNPVDYNSFLNLVVHLLGKCDVGAFDILSFVVFTAVPPETGSQTGEQVVEAHMLMFDLQRGVHGKRREGSGELPLLEGLAKETDQLVPLLLKSAESKRLPWLEKLLVFTAVRSGESFAAGVLSAIISKAETPQQLSLYFHLQESIERSLPGVPKMTVSSLYGSMAMSKPGELVRTLRNFERVIVGEKQRSKVLKASVSFLTRTVREDLGKLCEVLMHPDVDVSVCGLRLLSCVGVPAATDTAVLTRLSAVVVAVLFRVMWCRVEQSEQKAEGSKSRQYQTGIHLCHSCMRQLSRQTFTQSLLLHHLLGGTVSEDNTALFGGRSETAPKLGSSSNENSGAHLLPENRRLGLAIPLPRTHASVFHAGVIGQGLKRKRGGTHVSKEWVLRNQETLLEAIWSCCQPRMSEAAARTLGCAFVEVTTMDTLYNDVNWPDPEFSKVTLERDLHVWRMMEDNPVLWSILRAVSG
ncbi:hypothetical protein BaRGS_00028488, partial [Batillaria attramentaria]